MTQQWSPMNDVPSLKGKIAVVTGGNNDIGREMARLLVKKSAKVYFTTRSEAKAIEARKKILDAHPDINFENLQWMTMDLADIWSVTSAAEKMKEKESKVDILVHNAAAAITSTGLVGPGWEVHMATNFIGPFLFPNRLLPLLKKALQDRDADVRRYLGRFIFGFDTTRYGVSKAANLIFAQELQRLMDEQNLLILSIAVHPGEVATEGVFSINPSLVKTIARRTFISPEQGAVTPIFAAASKEIRQDPSKCKGRFVFPGGKIGNPNPVTSNEEQVTGLWRNATEEVAAQLRVRGLPSLQPWY
ncbi:short-chain dehydrogenase/reductase family Oxidoreductase [Colletotrichum salicis]|uniref:Short-chain dehydrogenase/reductase family Oxidoreductase n=1 Tax=Colletotrichum salicis TaxID=1209931 RepID=A0A135UTD2_9PEZI|nr:short-chain dehydrogenase/reductase family Oxidoreductase [Colletotrichum salicis]